MKKIYICSPLRGDYKNNIEDAKRHCRTVALKGFIPIAPHIYLTQFLDDTSDVERQIGTEMGLELLKDCDAVWVYGEPTEGMRNEIRLAERLGIKVKEILMKGNYAKKKSI